MRLYRHLYMLLVLALTRQATVSVSLFGQPLKRVQYASYNIDEGLLHSQVLDIAEDGNGFIWVSTGNGVQRFDGRIFHQITTSASGLPDDKYIRFFKLNNGNLLFRHQRGLSEYNINTNKFNPVWESQNPETDNIPFVLGEDRNGIWCLVQGKGFFKINPSFKGYADSIPYPSPGSKGGIAQGNLFFLQLGPMEIVLCNPATKTSGILTPDTRQQYFHAAASYSADTILVATSKGIEKLNVVSGKSLPVCAYANRVLSGSPPQPVFMKRVSSEIFLVSEGNQLFELDIRTGRYISSFTGQHNRSFLSIGYITRIMTDSFNNIWLTSENNGMFKLHYSGSRFRYFGTTEHENNFVKSIYADKSDNRVLCGSFGKGLLIFDTSQNLLCAIRDFPGAPAPYTVCAFRKTGPHQYLVLLMGDWHCYLLDTRKFSVEKIKVVNKDMGIRSPLDYHLSLFRPNDSIDLLQTGMYLYRLKIGHGIINTEFLYRFAPPSTSAYIDKEGGLWVGSIGSFFYGQKDYRSFIKTNLSERVFCRNFLQDKNGGIWMGTGKGLYLLDSTGLIKRIIRQSDGLLDENIYAIRQDRNRNLWLSHNKGISCMKTDGSFMHFGRSDGLQENEFNTNTYFETPDGEFYFGGVNGISSFYPESVFPNTDQPRLLLTSIKVKDNEWKTDTPVWNLEQIVLPFTENHLAFEFTAIGDRAPHQYNYQYRMKGADDTWINSEKRGVARYSLSPGKYIFDIWAGSSFHPEAPPLKSMSVIILPPFWKSSWFIGSMILFLLALIVFSAVYISRSNLKKRILELERKRAIDEERLRIAREMHDDIGAGLTQITLMSEAARKTIGSEQWAEEIAGTSRKLVGNMSEIIWSMNPANNSLQQLLSYLREQLNLLLLYSGIDYSIDFPENEKDVALNHSQCRNLLLVTKEVVHNCIRHSAAGNIKVACRFTGEKLLFDITDNGKGFDTANYRPGNGLRNIRHRIEELGGTLQVESAPGKGSRFHYQIPLTVSTPHKPT